MQVRGEFMPFCQKCGEAFKEGEQFCPKCGSSTGAQQPTAQAQAPAKPVAPPKEVKKITISGILAWIFGVFFLLGGLGGALENAVGGLLMIIGSLLILPPTNNMLKNNLNLELSGWLRFILFIFLIAIGMSMVGLQSSGSDVVVQPTETVSPGPAPTAAQTQEPEPVLEPPKQKVKSATITVDRVVESVANLGDIRITVTNTGDVSIRPNFDVIVSDSDGNAVCEDSPLFGIGSIASGEKKTDEISLLMCMFDEDGDYTVKVDMLDEDYNKLDSGEKSLIVNYWGQFGI